MFNRHRILAALGAGLVAAATTVAGPVGVVCGVLGVVVTTLVDPRQVLPAGKATAQAAGEAGAVAAATAGRKPRAKA
ncbi:MAG TPA: hypothetical protein VD931_10405 [Baekduia sp.]|nr:hypothetical protein [Baekduia sp.]